MDAYGRDNDWTGISVEIAVFKNLDSVLVIFEYCEIVVGKCSSVMDAVKD